jgi:DNA excision repair protein ERCC-1
MFRIPTYEELEKKEKEFNNERKDYKIGLFQKRKLLDADSKTTNTTDESTNKINSSSIPCSNSVLTASTSCSLSNKEDEREPEMSTKKARTSEEFQMTASEPDEKIEVNNPNNNTNDGDNDDDDDLLLNMFIKDNKHIIEKPTSQTKEDDVNYKKLNSENKFLVPNVPPAPQPIKQQILTSNSTSSASSYSSSGGGLIVNSSQRGNLVLKHIRNVQWKFCDQITPDFQINKTMCAFFLSMKYHLLNPTYLHKRVKMLGRAYNLRVLLALVDVKEPRHCIKELEKVAIFANLTLILCWSNEEVARYLETYKAYELKSAEAIMEKATQPVVVTNAASAALNSDANFVSSITDFLCQIKSINKTDASTLRQTYGSIKQLSLSSKDQLNLCPGLGPLKVNRLYEIFRTPFLINKK